jgi:hypothetical protein
MAEVTARRGGELVRGVFRVLAQFPDGLPAKDVLTRLRSVVPPTPFEDSDYPARPGVRRYEKIVRFSTIKAVKAGWLVKEKGRWLLTDEGRKALDAYQDPEEFERQVDKLYKRWEASLPEEAEEEPKEGPAAGVTFEEAEEMAWREVEEYLLDLDPYDFQNLVKALLQGMGYHVAWIAAWSRRRYRSHRLFRSPRDSGATRQGSGKAEAREGNGRGLARVHGGSRERGHRAADFGGWVHERCGAGGTLAAGPTDYASGPGKALRPVGAILQGHP